MTDSAVHKVTKIRLSQLGYLPDIPYHLISDAEMIDAFINGDRVYGSGEADSAIVVRLDNLTGYFADMYPCPSSELTEAYNELIAGIVNILDAYKLSIGYPTSLSGDIVFLTDVIPNWIYSYMLGEVVGPNSNTKDIHDCLVMLDLDNLDDEFTSEASEACLVISKQWIQKLPSESITAQSSDGTTETVTWDRPATMFGEPHVIKSLRLSTTA